MMSSTVNIVEYIDGKYKLNREELYSTISLAKSSGNIAMISIIGQPTSGKSFLMNCLMSYLECDISMKSNWPQNLTLVHKYGFHNDDKNNHPVVQMISKPFIMKDRNTAVFLMDTSGVFTDHLHISKTQIMKDIIGLFMYTSSTVIYNKRKCFGSRDLIELRESSEESLNFIKNVDKFQELFFYIQDWDPKSHEKHLFGSKGGKAFIENESKDLDFQNIFSKIECYLMPSPEENIKSLDKDLSKLDGWFIVQLSQMIKNKLINVGEMEIKRKPKTDQYIKAEELVELFESYVKKLNGDQNDDGISILSDGMSKLKLVEEATRSFDKTGVPSDQMDMDVTYTTHYDNDEKNKYENYEVTQNQISNHCETILNELKAGLSKAVLDPNFDFNNDLAKAFNDEMTKSKSAFFNQFKNKIPHELYGENMELLSTKINQIEYDFKENVDKHIKELRHEYGLAKYTPIEIYDKKMRSLISRQLSSQDLDVDPNIDNQIKLSLLDLFEQKVVQIDGFNTNLLNEFKDVLKDDFNHRKKKYERALDLVKSYRNEWTKYLSKYRYISPSHLSQTQDKLIEKNNLLLDELEDQELKQIVIHSMLQIFNSIEIRNEEINNDEKALAEEVVNFVYDLFYDCLHQKLKSEFFSEEQVKTLHEQLLEKALQTMKTHCDFKKYQDHLAQKCKNDLKNKLDENYLKFLNDYLKLSANARAIVKSARDEAINMYRSEMKEKFSVNFPHKQNEFETIMSEFSKNALKLNKIKMDCLKEDFDELFFESLVSQNESYITGKIKIQNDKFAEQNKKNYLDVSCISIYFGRFFLSAAYHDREIQYILDKNGNKFRTNSIAFTNDTLFGDEARAHYENFDSDANSFDKTFDIKQLIGKSRKRIKQESTSFPFEFMEKGENMRIRVKTKFIKHDFAIESLIALQMSDIQIDAQKQLGKSVSRAVLTIPTSYNLRQIDAFRNVAKIAGFGEVYILSEMNAFALGFAKDMNRLNRYAKSTVFFVVINEYFIDAALIDFKYNNIEYKAYYNKNLKSDESPGRSMNFAKGSEKRDVNYDFTSALGHLFDECIKMASIHKQMINNIVITGDSILTDHIKDFSTIYFGPNSLTCFYPLDIVMDGSVEYIQNMTRDREQRVIIYDIFPHRFVYEFRNKNNVTILRRYFPMNGVDKFNYAQFFYLPLQLCILQDNILVSVYYLTYMSPQNNQPKWSFTEIQFGFQEFGKLQVVFTNPHVYVPKVKFEEHKFGLNDREISEENNIIAFIKLKIMDKHEIVEKLSMINQAKEDLEEYYKTVKNSVENNSLLRGLKLRRINNELKVTSNLLQSNETVAKLFALQKLKLQEIFEILED